MYIRSFGGEDPTCQESFELQNYPFGDLSVFVEGFMWREVEPQKHLTVLQSMSEPSGNFEISVQTGGQVKLLMAFFAVLEFGIRSIAQ